MFPVASYGIFQIVRRLICSASGNILGVNDRKVLGLVTALEVKRLVVGAIDMSTISRGFKRDRSFIGSVPSAVLGAGMEGSPCSP